MLIDEIVKLLKRNVIKGYNVRGKNLFSFVESLDMHITPHSMHFSLYTSFPPVQIQSSTILTAALIMLAAFVCPSLNVYTVDIGSNS